MYPINNIAGIEEQEEKYKKNHGIMLLFVKPTDKNASEIIDNFNYLHKKAKDYCAIYAIGYSQVGCNKQYDDVRIVKGTSNQNWEYSDECFIEVCEQLEKRLTNWFYVGEPTIIFLQNNVDGKSSKLNFRNYNHIDINYGIEKGYIDSFQRFMERIIRACKNECEENVLKRAKNSRFSGRNLIQLALEYDNKLPQVIKDIIGDRVFFKSCRISNKNTSVVL